MIVTALSLPIDALRASFGKRLRLNQPLARYTSARIGGSADALVDVLTAEELENDAQKLWELGVPFIVLGGGSNMLVSDAGVREVVLFNQASQVKFENHSVWAESGAGLGAIARQAARKDLGGLEWAAGIPGTLGGAVVGNAGAHGGDISTVLRMATILHQEKGKQEWTGDDFAYGYRESSVKRSPGQAVVLAARLALSSKPESEIRAQMDTFLAYRRLTQPPGASMGSMFKNPPGDSAGRLIEAVGMKGTKIGNTQISPLHANFFLNLGDARAVDVSALIEQARDAVQAKFNISLALEIALVGEWNER